MKKHRVLILIGGAGAVFVLLHGLHGFNTNGGCIFCKYMKGE